MSSIIAKRYAKAFYNTTSKKDTVQDMTMLRDCIDVSNDFKRFLKDPSLSEEECARCIDALFANKLSKETINFLKFLQAKGRLDFLKGICEDYIKIYEAENNIASITIESAYDLSSAKIKTIESAVADKLNKKIESTHFIIPELIGGVRVVYEDQVFDFTLSNELEKFKEQLLTV